MPSYSNISVPQDTVTVYQLPQGQLQHVSASRWNGIIQVAVQAINEKGQTEGPAFLEV